MVFVAALCQTFGPHYRTSPHDNLLDHTLALEAQSKGVQVRSRSTSVSLILLDLDLASADVPHSPRNQNIC
jgi:hypothetical protein